MPLQLIVVVVHYYYNANINIFFSCMLCVVCCVLCAVFCVYHLNRFLIIWSEFFFFFFNKNFVKFKNIRAWSNRPTDQPTDNGRKKNKTFTLGMVWLCVFDLFVNYKFERKWRNYMNSFYVWRLVIVTNCCWFLLLSF